jgi:hypothetical protein
MSEGIFILFATIGVEILIIWVGVKYGFFSAKKSRKKRIYQYKEEAL